MTNNNKETIKRELKGIVVSDKMNKVVVVRVDRLKKHSRYLKYYRVSHRFKARDEKGEYKVGDKVVIQSSRPLSKEVRWMVTRKLETRN